ncbi:serine/threonine protein kinase [Corallococcus aberystwythensis]|uniref:Serine/threonine protein kinase n=1 Tax=Corallococcus aberystwythensis TaxID=2316722 RepID=A0A3A8QUH3_9BACT|nr:serine/threonine-protein kinase [Corallococcus aberystwythensis]RKH72343.1 serine/threonine protein kinase [Corallococcus aberystwythensis]
MSSPQTATPFGKYLLIKRLALGGMAELFLAHRPPDPTLVVIKRILPYLSEEPEFVQMFLDEARIAAQLHHPNIVQVHELGKEGDNIFICMEYVEGVDLRRVLMEEHKFGASMPYGVAAKICAAIAAGLDHAHFSRGVDGRPLELIHRDVSPQNVMLAYDGRVKLVDFGIAKAGAFMERSKPGVIKGKFLYLSPEQIMQERLDHRADIYALGVMLYEITTGKQPFHRATTEGILYAIRYEEATPPHLVRPDYPEDLSRIVMRCLVKDRTQRYQRASDVRHDLEAFLASGVLKQSLDVTGYIARLLGAKEERTVLHIPPTKRAGRHEATLPLPSLRTPLPPPVPDLPEDTAARTLPLADAEEDTAARTLPLTEDTAARTLPLTGDEDTAARTLPLGGTASQPRGASALTPAGLVARPPPARRPTAEAAALRAWDAEEREPETQMARPRELPTGHEDDEDDDGESTAVGTMPGAPTPRRHLEPVFEAEAWDEEAQEEDEDADSTVPLRARRPRPAPPAPARRGGPPEPTARSGPPGERRAPDRTRRPSSGVAMPRGTGASDDPFAPTPRRTPPHAPADRASTPPPAPRRSGIAPADDGRSEPLSSGPRRMGDDGRVSQPPGPRRGASPTSDANRSAPPGNPGARNVRPPPRPSPADDERFATDPGASGMSLTGPTPVTIGDPDDDESTIGFHAPRRPPPRRAVRAPVAVDEGSDDVGPDTLDSSGSLTRSRRAALVVVGVLLVAVLGLGAAWMMGLFSPEAQAPPVPMKRPPAGGPVRPGPQGTAPVKAPAPVPAEVAPPKPTQPVLAETAQTPDAGLAVAATGTETAAPPAVETVASAEPARPAERAEPQAPATVDVRFDAPVRTVLGRPGGGKLPINQVVALAPGPLRVQYTCPGKRAPRGIETYNIRPVTGELQTLRVPCRRRR